MQNRPTYAIESVDRALRLAALLQQEGSLRVTDAATALGISVSGTHRLLAMLVYLDFAEQLPDRSYGPGPLLRSADLADAPLALLRRIGPAHLRTLADLTGESANLAVRVGTEARFVSTVEAGRFFRVGDRTGKSLPAELTSGGRALLAAAPLDELARLYGSELDVILPRLARVRNDGYATNRDETEHGVTAVGMAVGSPPVCAVSVSLPTTSPAHSPPTSLSADRSNWGVQIQPG